MPDNVVPDDMVKFQLSVLDAAAHLFAVECRVAVPAGPLSWSLPDWIPGSYMIRDFARHVVSMKGSINEQSLTVRKAGKSEWQAQAPEGGELVLCYQVYAWDLSVRGAHLDQTHGFFNGTSVFVSVAGSAGLAQQVEICRSSALPDWRVGTAMVPLHVDAQGFGSYLSQDYDELLDHPVEMGTFERVEFEACGVPHEVILTGRFHADLPRLCADLKKICVAQIQFFGEPAPMQRYVFMVMVVGDGYGGLEHRASTALMISREELPVVGEAEVNDRYLKFLSLCSHEYFHTWNVKRIRPAEFVPFDLSQEVHTRQLWAFEGITSYYDDLFLYRTGLIDAQRYLGLVAQTISRVYRGSGRHKQSLSDSSFDAWTRFYKQDENAPNAIVSYYAKGMLVAMALDLVMRMRTDNRVGLDDVMRRLWREYLDGKEGIEDRHVERVAEELCGSGLSDFFEHAVRGFGDLPLDEYLASHGVEMRWRSAESGYDKSAALERGNATNRASIGLQLGKGCTVGFVFHGGAAHLAGVSAGDELIAWDCVRLSAASLKQALLRYAPGDKIPVTAFRRDELMQFELVLQAAPLDVCSLSSKEGREELRDEWLLGS